MYFSQYVSVLPPKAYILKYQTIKIGLIIIKLMTLCTQDSQSTLRIHTPHSGFTLHTQDSPLKSLSYPQSPNFLCGDHG